MLIIFKRATRLWQCIGSGNKGHRCCLLGLCLLRDALDGQSFLPDDGPHKLGGHQNAQRDVQQLVRGAGSRGGAVIPGGPNGGPPAGPVCRNLRRLLIRYVRDLQGVGFKLVAIQLLNGTETQERLEPSLPLLTCPQQTLSQVNSLSLANNKPLGPAFTLQNEEHSAAPFPKSRPGSGHLATFVSL